MARRKIWHDELIVGEYRAGASYRQIEKKLGVSLGVISRIIRRNGIPLHLRPSGDKHYAWKGGKYRDVEGYMVEYSHDRQFRRFTHRVLMEAHLGRDLRCWEVVHHINEDKRDNRLENLVVMPGREHDRFHKFLSKRRLKSDRTIVNSVCRFNAPSYARFTKKDLCKARELFPCNHDRNERRRCRVHGCLAPVFGHKRCSKHYQRWIARLRGFWLSGGGKLTPFYGKRWRKQKS